MLHCLLRVHIFLVCLPCARAQIVRTTVEHLGLAVKGELVMSPELDKVSPQLFAAS